MRIPLQRAFLLLVGLAALLLTTNIVWAQQEYAERLRSPATVRGFIGGESHDSYVIRARKGQVMTVRISWIHEHSVMGDNFAEFWVGELPDFDGDGEVKFGRKSNKGRRWSGKIPRTGNYYIYVVAHPTARFTLRVTVK
jgi:hypothetical protein